MKATELRIGNYYQYAGNGGIVYTQVQAIKYNQFGLLSDFDGTNFEICKPIQLTEEWLLRFGFKEFLIDETWYFIKNDFVFEISGIIGFHNYNELESICFNENKCKYVHQLQNLYFALTGEELTL